MIGEDWSAIAIRTKGLTYLLLILYMVSGIGPSGANVRRMQSIAGLIGILGIPFILIGDWNMTPQQLFNSGFTNLIKGSIMVPEDADYICRSGRLLDYAVVSRSFVAAIASVKTSKDTPWHSHRGVVVEVHLRPRRIHILAMSAPKLLVGKNFVLKGEDEIPDWDSIPNFKGEYQADDKHVELLERTLGKDLIKDSLNGANDYSAGHANLSNGPLEVFNPRQMTV